MYPAVAADIGAGEITGLVLAAGTLIATVTASMRGLRTDKATAAEREDAAIVAGYAGLTAELRAEVARLRAEFEADRRTWAAERAAWAAERASLLEEIAALRRRVLELEEQVRH